MEAEKKAKELVDKFSNVALLDSYEAKQCAIIAVDEILNAIRYTDAENDLGYVGFWQEVKREIEKL
jgi:hypothetical protein